MESHSDGRFGPPLSRRTLLSGAGVAAAGAALGPVARRGGIAAAQAGAIGAGWTHVVGGGGSILFYNKNTGEAMTGTLGGSGFTQVEYYSGIIRFAKGYKVMVGTPSGSMLFVRPSGNGVAGTLVNGVWTLRNEYRGFAPWDVGGATRDSVFLFNWDTRQGASGTLVDGAWTYYKRYRNSFQFDYTRIGATDDSLVFYRACSRQPAKSGTLENGVWSLVYPFHFEEFNTVGGQFLCYQAEVGAGDTLLVLSSTPQQGETGYHGVVGRLVDGAWRVDHDYVGFGLWRHAAHAGNGFVLLYDKESGLAAYGTLGGGEWSYYGTT